MFSTIPVIKDEISPPKSMLILALLTNSINPVIASTKAAIPVAANPIPAAAAENDSNIAAKPSNPGIAPFNAYDVATKIPKLPPISNNADATPSIGIVDSNLSAPDSTVKPAATSRNVAPPTTLPCITVIAFCRVNRRVSKAITDVKRLSNGILDITFKAPDNIINEEAIISIVPPPVKSPFMYFIAIDNSANTTPSTPTAFNADDALICES